MILPSVGISKRRRLPAIKIVDAVVFPRQALNALWAFRNWKAREVNDSLVELEMGKEGSLVLSRERAGMIFLEWPQIWERYYCPIDVTGKVVLDVGAGEGETTAFYFHHGAKKVVCVEPSERRAELLRLNKKENGWNCDIFQEGFEPSKHLRPGIGLLKSDCEGCESNLLGFDGPLPPTVLEVHAKELRAAFLARGMRQVYSNRTNTAWLLSNVGLRSAY